MTPGQLRELAEEIEEAANADLLIDFSKGQATAVVAALRFHAHILETTRA